jgi:hypothetical protein
VKTKFITSSILTAFCLLAVIFSAAAQAETPLTLNLRRNFGYSSGAGEVQGNFTLKATPNQAVERVVFYLDGEPMGEATSEPYELRFVTDNHPAGVHSLSAKGFTASGQELESNIIRVNFVTAEASRNTMFKILGFVFGALILVMIITWAISSLLGKKVKPVPLGAQRNYGMLGGSICPRCFRPFPRSLLGANLVVGRLERCPHCGKWSLVHRASLESLRVAEQAELELAEDAVEVPSLSEEERLRKELDNSRYQDL